MSRIVWEVINENGVEKQFKCSVDGTVLWEELDNGFSIKGTDCEHFYWDWAGNGCYPDQLDPEICYGIEDIVKKAVKKIWSGTTIWFLLPKTQ